MRILVLIIMLTAASQSHALRCGTRLVQKGDHLMHVLKRCGEPAYREAWVEDKLIARRPHRLLPYRHEPRSVSVKQWTYNFGKRRFMRMIRFEDGIVTEIRSLDYGY